MTIQSDYLNDLATHTNEIIDRVVINDSIIITDFTLKRASANVFEIKYIISSSQTALITNIKLTKSDGTIMSSSAVNIPISEDEVFIRQTITISEVIT